VDYVPEKKDVKMRISEIQVMPIKPFNGLVGFASLVLDDNLYLGSIGIMTRPGGGYRLTYPTKKAGVSDLNVFYPINRSFAQEIEQAVIEQFEEVMKASYVGHNQVGDSTPTTDIT
jgi:stage V sporulation protein G